MRQNLPIHDLGFHVTWAIVLAAWVCWAVYWVVAARGTKPGRVRWRRAVGLRLAVAVIVIALIRARVITSAAAITNRGLEAVGIALVLVGLGWAVWARRNLKRNWGPPMTQKQDPDLITAGPYRWVRHPIYSGMLLALVGTALGLSWFLFILVAFVTGYFVYSATQEERYMIQQFPDAYPAYRRTTKMLIPFVF